MRLGWYPKIQCFDDDGVPLVGGKLYCYDPETSLPKDAYIEWNPPDAPIPYQTHPIILDARGEATVYLDGAYKLILTDSQDVEIWTQYYVPGVMDLVTDQAISGIKTFHDLPRASDIPIIDTQLVNKAYVDNIGAGTPSHIQDNTYIYADDIGTILNKYEIELNPAITYYTAGQLFYFKVGSGRTNTDQATLKVNQQAEVPILKMAEGIVPQELAPGDIREHDICAVIYNDQYSAFLLLAPVRKRALIPHTWAIPGLIEQGMFIVPWFVPVPASQSAQLKYIRHQIKIGTSAIISLTKNDVTDTTWKNILVNTTAVTSSFDPLSLVHGDKLGLKIESTTDTVTDLSFSLWIEYAV